IAGIELAASYDFGAARGYPWSLRLFANGTRLLQAEETTAGVTPDIRNVADLTLGGGAEFADRGRLSLPLTRRHVGEPLDTDFSDFATPGDVRYPRFLVFDLSGTYDLTPRYRIHAQVANLGDEHYYEIRGYPMPGREFRLGFGIDW